MLLFFFHLYLKKYILIEVGEKMELVIIVLNKTDLLDELLTEFMNNDLSGATVLDSSGMGHLISNQFPMFSMFAELDDEKENNSKTILKVVRSIEERERTEELVEKIIGDFKDPDTAIMISLPVSSAKGINY